MDEGSIIEAVTMDKVLLAVLKAEQTLTSACWSPGLVNPN